MYLCVSKYIDGFTQVVDDGLLKLQLHALPHRHGLHCLIAMD